MTAVRNSDGEDQQPSENSCSSSSEFEDSSSSDDSNDDTGDAAAIDQRSNPDLEMAAEETNTRPMSYEVDE